MLWLTAILIFSYGASDAPAFVTGSPGLDGAGARSTIVAVVGSALSTGPCGEPAAGGCCEANGLPGCDDAECCNIVCVVDPFCCDSNWDCICVDEAIALCTECLCADNADCDDCNECTDDQCSDGTCQFDSSPAGTSCGDPSDTECDNPDTCDGAGTCLDNFEPARIPCDTDSDPCSIERCDSMGACTPRAAEFDGGCGGANPQWSCSTNWQDDVVPNNDMMNTFAVELDTVDDVLLDIDVVIDSLRIVDEATLSATQPVKGTGNLAVLEPCGILVEGQLFVADSPVIDASAGAVTIGPGGVYSAAPAAPPGVAASLTAGDITVLEGPGGTPGGALILSESMAAVSLGDLILDAGAGLNPGNCTPRLIAGDDAFVGVGDDVIVMGDVEVLYNSSTPLVLGDDFINESTNPLNFDWLDGDLLMNGPAHMLEVAGEDRGATISGLVDNFAFGALILAELANVELSDSFDNQLDGGGACDEALYVGILFLDTDAVLNTNGCKLYYYLLVNNGSIPGLEEDVLPICPGDFNVDFEVNIEDLLALLADWGPCPACVTDLDHDDVVSITDLLIFLPVWGPCPLN